MFSNRLSRFLVICYIFVKVIVKCHDAGGAENWSKETAIMTKYGDLQVEDVGTTKHESLNSNGKYHQLTYNHFTYYTNALRNIRKPGLEVKVKSMSNSIKTLSGVLKWNRGVQCRRTAAPILPSTSPEDHPTGTRRPTDLIWKSVTQISNHVKRKEDDHENYKSFLHANNDTDVMDYLATQNNYYTIPKKTVELMQSNQMCPRKENEVQPCTPVFMKSERVGRVWPRELLTTSCRCHGQRCNLMGLDTCTTLVSRVTVIGHQGTRSRDIVPVACVCMAFRGIPAREVIPVLV